MAKRIITIIVESKEEAATSGIGSTGHSIVDGDKFAGGLTLDELLGAIPIIVLRGSIGYLRTEADQMKRLERINGSADEWHFHPLDHGGHRAALNPQSPLEKKELNDDNSDSGTDSSH